ncbi:hypothetical protein [Sphingopyxis sp. PET50]|uniref:hypothetical protein n=1 Tax=Sphingopyxis sp. PET50 TaxID=2976533 RepID=UPI0021AE514A|nr:hypothetical protein [Sphingopyxis sp. PET50]
MILYARTIQPNYPVSSEHGVVKIQRHSALLSNGLVMDLPAGEVPSKGGFLTFSPDDGYKVEAGPTENTIGLGWVR